MGNAALLPGAGRRGAKRKAPLGRGGAVPVGAGRDVSAEPCAHLPELARCARRLHSGGCGAGRSRAVRLPVQDRRGTPLHEPVPERAVIRASRELERQDGVLTLGLTTQTSRVRIPGFRAMRGQYVRVSGPRATALLTVGRGSSAARAAHPVDRWCAPCRRFRNAAQSRRA